jgi:hypothetical protein
LLEQPIIHEINAHSMIIIYLSINLIPVAILMMIGFQKFINLYPYAFNMVL